MNKESGQKRDGGMKKKLPGRPGGDRTIVRFFRIKDYDAVLALWRRSEGVGLNESDTRAAIAAFLRRNPCLSFIAEKKGRIIGDNNSSVRVWRNSARRAFKNATSSFSPATGRA
jgi:hypothetical protein